MDFLDLETTSVHIHCAASMETQIAAIRTVYNIGNMATTPVPLVGNDEGELSLGAIAYTITQDRDWPKLTERDKLLSLWKWLEASLEKGEVGLYPSLCIHKKSVPKKHSQG